MSDSSNDSYDFEAEPYESSEILEITVDEGYQGGRLDQFLAAQLDYSRSLIQDWIKAGRVMVDFHQVKASSKLKQGQNILIEVPPLEPADPLPDSTIPLEVVYEDEHILLINKQRGLVVHPGIGNPDGTLVNALLAMCPDIQGIGGEIRPGIVHRLDKNTSGLMVAAKTHRAHNDLSAQIKARQVTKGYLALVEGVPKLPEGKIDVPVGRHPRHRTRMAVVVGGKEARTSYKARE